jgi:hypothetical protein
MGEGGVWLILGQSVDPAFPALNLHTQMLSGPIPPLPAGLSDKELV